MSSPRQSTPLQPTDAVKGMPSDRTDFASPEGTWVSIVVPCRNEAARIERTVESLLSGDWPHDRLEVLVVDGMSDDGTRDVLQRLAARHPCVRVLDNPRRITPEALNLGIARSRGSVVLIAGAHAQYPSQFVSALVHRLLESEADAVGGACRTRPANDTPMARAIALGLSHPLGVGNALFRTGVTEPRWVDTVPFGCYRREVFDRIGLFDVEMIRNQDDELNHRLIRSGGRILLVPDVTSEYYARDSLARLWRMYYQYGYFKPLGVRKVGGVVTVRQLVPGLFVLSLIICAMAASWSIWGVGALAAVLLAYVLAVGVCCLRAVRRHGPRCAACLALVFPTLHVSYGLGYLAGVVRFLILRRGAVRDPAAVPLSR